MNIARFEELYQSKDDPWNYCFSPYEQEKYETTLKSLPKPHYKHGLEVGCSIGVLTERLAKRCSHITAIDCSPTALEKAKHYCGSDSTISFVCAELPQEWPEGQFDLIVFSEILYYFPPDIIRHLAHKAAMSLAFGGDCVVVNYRQPMTELVQGDEASEIFGQAFYTDSAFSTPLSLMRENYRIDILNLED